MTAKFDISETLMALAERWPTYPTRAEHVYVRDGELGLERVAELVDIRRCCRCHEEVYAAGDGAHQVVAHLLRSHGYRMDGRQWSGRNELLGHA